MISKKLNFVLENKKISVDEILRGVVCFSCQGYLGEHYNEIRGCMLCSQASLYPVIPRPEVL